MSETYLLYVVMVVFTVASPGPGVLMTLDNAIAAGWRESMLGVLGLALGAAVMAGLSSAGVGLLVHSSPTLFLVLKYCGVSYLFYLAYKTWTRKGIVLSTRERAPAGSLRLKLLARGALLQTSNPKSLLFFLSVLPQVAEASGGDAVPTTRLIVAIATYCLVLIAVHALYAALASRARLWLARPAASRLLSRLSALVFLAFGIAMLTLKL